MKHPLIISSDGKALGKQGAGRSQLTASMAAPCCRQLDYQGLARKVFQVQQLPPGALPCYDRDVDVVGALNLGGEDSVSGRLRPAPIFKNNKLLINSNGKPGKASTLNGFDARKVIFPTFDIVSSPTIRISDVKERRFKVIDRAVQRAKQRIMAREDEEIFKALDDLVESGNKKE